MSRLAAAIVGAALLLPLVAAAPATLETSRAQTEPGDVDGELELTFAEPVTFSGEQATGAVNVWSHVSIWDGNTCWSDSVENRCDRILVHVAEGGDATFTMTPGYAPADYDLVIYESSKSGEAFTRIAQSQNEMFVAGEGPVPLPGPETVTFDTDEDGWYLAVVFYRAAGGGYELVGELAASEA